ncbi:MAG: hypothetical protein WDZ51_18905 [Pirellulaceae bacterium]
MSSLLVAVGVVYVGFGHPAPLGTPQASLYGHHEDNRSSGREDRSRRRRAPSESPRERWSQERAEQQALQRQISQRWRNEHGRHWAGRKNDQEDKDSESEVTTSEQEGSSPRSESRDRRRRGGMNRPGTWLASSTPPPTWYQAPGPSQLSGEPGILMPEPVRGKLDLDAAQHRELDQIQQEMEGRLQAVLTPEQFAKLEKLREEFLDQELGTR